MLDNYCKVLAIEGLTMIEMGKKEIFPAVNRYIADLCKLIEQKQKLGLACAQEKALVVKLTEENEALFAGAGEIERLLTAARGCESAAAAARFFAEKVVPAMQEMRAFADDMEMNTAKDYWPFPTYGDILFSVS